MNGVYTDCLPCKGISPPPATYSCDGAQLPYSLTYHCTFQKSLFKDRAVAAVLQPGSLKWWQFLDDRGIDGDQLLDDPEPTTTAHTTLPEVEKVEDSEERWHIESTTAIRRILTETGKVVAHGEGRHWEAARGLLAQYRPMMDASCPLFARKFSRDGAEGVAELAKGFASSLGNTSDIQKH